MIPDLPANPLSIELTIAHRRLWWHVEDHDEDPEPWEVSADVWEPDVCPEDMRHVADLSLALVDLLRERNLLETVGLGQHVRDFLTDAVDRERRRLHPGLEDRIAPGPARFVIVQRVDVTEEWRGHGVGMALLAGTLRTLAKNARFAVAAPSPIDFAEDDLDEVAAELNTARMNAMLEHIGFWRWRSVHVVDLRSRALLDARKQLINRWSPTTP